MKDVLKAMELGSNADHECNARHLQSTLNNEVQQHFGNVIKPLATPFHKCASHTRIHRQLKLMFKHNFVRRCPNTAHIDNRLQETTHQE
jgi:hypothetical protein